MKVNLSTIATNAPSIFHRLRWNGVVTCPECGSIHIYNKGVSQTTAWNMLMKIRSAIRHDIRVPEGAILDEVFIGSDGKRIPSFKKYSKVPPPPPHYNLSGEDLKKYYRSEFYRLASEDKIPVLGISSVFDRKLILMTIAHPTEKSS